MVGMLMAHALCCDRRDRDAGAEGGALRAGDEAAHEEPHAGISAAVLGGVQDAPHVLPSAKGASQRERRVLGFASRVWRINGRTNNSSLCRRPWEIVEYTRSGL